MDELEKADFSNPEDIEKANRNINVSFKFQLINNIVYAYRRVFLLKFQQNMSQVLKKELQHDLEQANKIGEKARERYNGKQVPLPTDIAKQLSSIKVLFSHSFEITEVQHTLQMLFGNGKFEDKICHTKPKYTQSKHLSPDEVARSTKRLLVLCEHFLLFSAQYFVFGGKFIRSTFRFFFIKFTNCAQVNCDYK